MNTAYILAGGGGIAVLVMITVAAIWMHRAYRSASSGEELSKEGKAVSEQILKSAHLSSDFILETIEDGVVMVGHDNVIHAFNQAASNLTGWPAEEALGLDFKSVLPLVNERGEQYPAEHHPFTQALSTGTAVRDNKGMVVTRRGKQIPISLIVSPVTDPKKKVPVSVVGVFRDITKEKAEESQRSEFISTASHEMRTPIAAIEGYLALTLNDEVSKIDDRARKYLEKAHLSTKQLSQLFQDLLTSSKAEDGRLTSYPSVVEIGELVGQVTDAARFNAEAKGLTLQFTVSNEETAARVVRPLFYAFVDPNRMREVLQNIIDNAIKYTLAGEVKVVVTGDSTVIQIQIQDTGPGIPAEDIIHLFQKFYRVDNSMTRSVGGTGLGLFISRKIVELYDGRIWAESQLDKGSTFFINLPRLGTDKALEMQKQEAAQASPLDVS